MEPTYNQKFIPVNKTEAKDSIWRTMKHDSENLPKEALKNKKPVQAATDYHNMPIIKESLQGKKRIQSQLKVSKG